MRVPDRQKQRREYLRKKAGVRGIIVGGQLLEILLFSVTGLCGLASFGLLLCSIAIGPQFYLTTLVSILLTVGGGYISWKLGKLTDRAEQEERSLAFVPPVTPDTLPAEEVLVRGAQELTQEQSTVLLRAAEESVASPTEELLRASIGKRE